MKNIKNVGGVRSRGWGGWVGGGGWMGGQGGCERRIISFCENSKKNIFFFLGGGRGGVGSGSDLGGGG